jgi:hypothetical protein
MNKDHIKLLDEIIVFLQQEKRHLIEENVDYKDSLELLDYIKAVINEFRAEKNV